MKKNVFKVCALNAPGLLGLHLEQAEILHEAWDGEDYLHPNCPRNRKDCTNISEDLKLN